MNILYLIKKWSGGVGSVVRNQKKGLESLGHNVDVISREDDLKIYSTTKSIFKIRSLLKEKEFDIIYTQDWSMALLLLFPYPIFRKKHFCCFHGIQPGKVKFLQKFVGKMMGNKLIVVGDSLKQIYPKSNVIYNGIDFDLFKPVKGIKRIPNSVGFVNWKTSDYHYEEIKVVCEKLGKKFMIAEGIKYEDMPKFYSSIETFVSLPPEFTGFNLSWIEAIACEVPKVIGNGFGIGNLLLINKVNDLSELENEFISTNAISYNLSEVKERFDLNKSVIVLESLFKVN